MEIFVRWGIDCNELIFSTAFIVGVKSFKVLLKYLNNTSYILFWYV